MPSCCGEGAPWSAAHLPRVPGPVLQRAEEVPQVPVAKHQKPDDIEAMRRHKIQTETNTICRLCRESGNGGTGNELTGCVGDVYNSSARYNSNGCALK